ncbi:MAG: hypothetical protein AAF517_23390, partial [Planctomycetota bacterium]
NAKSRAAAGRASALAGSGKREDARELLESLIGSGVGDAEVRAELAAIALEEGNLVGARELAEEALDDAGDDASVEADIRLILGKIYSAAAEHENADSELSAALVLYKDAGRRRRIARTLDQLAAVADAQKLRSAANDYRERAARVRSALPALE